MKARGGSVTFNLGPSKEIPFSPYQGHTSFLGQPTISMATI